MISLAHNDGTTRNKQTEEGRLYRASVDVPYDLLRYTYFRSTVVLRYYVSRTERGSIFQYRNPLSPIAYSIIMPECLRIAGLPPLPVRGGPKTWCFAKHCVYNESWPREVLNATERVAAWVKNSESSRSTAQDQETKVTAPCEWQTVAQGALAVRRPVRAMMWMEARFGGCRFDSTHGT